MMISTIGYYILTALQLHMIAFGAVVILAFDLYIAYYVWMFLKLLCGKIIENCKEVK